MSFDCYTFISLGIKETFLQVARFNLGSTVILVFEAPLFQGMDPNGKSGFSFSVNKGERVRMGQAIGKWQD